MSFYVNNNNCYDVIKDIIDNTILCGIKHQAIDSFLKYSQNEEFLHFRIPSWPYQFYSVVLQKSYYLQFLKDVEC